MTQATTTVRIWDGSRKAYAERTGGRVVVRVYDPVSGHYTVCHALTPAQEQYVICRTLPAIGVPPVYVIVKRRYFLAGTCHAVRGWRVYYDQATGNVTRYSSREDAREAISAIEGRMAQTPYYCDHGEYCRPSFAVRNTREPWVAAQLKNGDF